MTYEMSVKVVTLDDVLEFQNVEKIEHKNTYVRIFIADGDVHRFFTSDIVLIDVHLLEIEYIF